MTHATLVLPLSEVGVHVSHDLTVGFKCRLTHCTAERSLTAVYQEVGAEMSAVDKRLSTLVGVTPETQQRQNDI